MPKRPNTSVFFIIYEGFANVLSVISALVDSDVGGIVMKVFACIRYIHPQARAMQ